MNRFFQKRSTAISVVILFFGINCAGLGQRDMVIRGNPSHLRVLEEPMPEAEDFAGRDTLALRQARAAAELVRLGRGSMVWHLLQESSDNSLRTYLIRELGTVDPPVVFRQLEREKDVSIRRGLILSPGGFSGVQLPPTMRAPIIRKLLNWYRNDEDPGIRGLNRRQSARKLSAAHPTVGR